MKKPKVVEMKKPETPKREIALKHEALVSVKRQRRLSTQAQAHVRALQSQIERLVRADQEDWAEVIQGIYGGAGVPEGERSARVDFADLDADNPRMTWTPPDKLAEVAKEKVP